MGGSIFLCLILSILFTAVGEVLCKPILALLHTPQDMIGMAQVYLRTLYGGVCISFGYNSLAAFLRAAGDSRTPLIAVSLAAVCNIVLDFIFVVILHLGVFGAAFATLLSQLFSAVYCLWAIKRGGFVRPGWADFAIQPERLGQLLALGIPMGLQNVITGMGGVAVQSVINGFGTIFVAGFTAANKLLRFIGDCGGFLQLTRCVLTQGHNVGAGRLRQSKQGC